MNEAQNPPVGAAMPEAFRQQLAKLRSDQDRLFEDLRAGEARLRQLARSVWRIEEEERRRVARDLHDGLGQDLSALRHRLDHLRSDVPADERDALLDQARALCDAALGQTRNLARVLRPQILDDLGLDAALRWLARQCAETLGCEVEVDVQLGGRALDTELSTVAFRVVQEALTNVIRHSDAEQVSVRVAVRHDQLSVLVVDDGRGFDPEALATPAGSAGHAGLSGMRERVGLFGGRFAVLSAPGEGVQIRVSLPLSLQAVR